jgi:hypothetical protein
MPSIFGRVHRSGRARYDDIGVEGTLYLSGNAHIKDGVRLYGVNTVRGSVLLAGEAWLRDSILEGNVKVDGGLIRNIHWWVNVP